MRQSACLAVNPITVNNSAFLFNCTPVGRGSDAMIANMKLNIWLVGAGHLSVSWSIGVQCLVFFCSSVQVVLLTPQGSPGVSTGVTIDFSSLLHHSLVIDFNCCLDDTLMIWETSMRAEQPTKLFKPLRKMRGKLGYPEPV